MAGSIEHPVAQDYDREKAIYTPDLIAWVQEAWPDAWESLQTKFGSRAQDQLLSAVRRELDQKGTLEVIRGGVAVFGLRSDLKLAEFKPALGLNEEILKRYKANRLRVARQIKYSLHNENCIDLVLFLNGIPVATVELKTDNTQSIDDAVYQYKKDRQPKASRQKPEPLLSFPSGALVHFAVSNREVQMATKLEGFKTFFLPFNKGSDPGGKNCGKGNPLSDGHQTAYLWEEVWERESWLEILGRYLTAERNKKNEIHRVLFPRFHQLRVTRKLVGSSQGRRPRSEVLDPALRWLWQNELHCLDSSLLLRAPRRGEQEDLRFGDCGERSQRDRHPAPRSPGSLRAQERSCRLHQPQWREQKRAIG